MINLASRDIGHHLGRFLFTGIGLGLLIGVTLTMAGVYRGMVADGNAVIDASGADLWVVQKDTLGPWAEPSSIRDDVYRALAALPGVAEVANVAYLTMQVQAGGQDLRVMLAGVDITAQLTGSVRLLPGDLDSGSAEDWADATRRPRLFEQLLDSAQPAALYAYAVEQRSPHDVPVVWVELAEADGCHVASFPLCTGRGWAERDLLDLYGAALAQLRSAQMRQPGEVKLRVYNPRLEQHGWQSTHTVVEVLHHDLPAAEAVNQLLSRDPKPEQG